MSKKVYTSIIGCIINVLVLLSFSISYGAGVELSWDQNTEEALAGYFVYYGTSSRNYFENPLNCQR